MRVLCIFTMLVFLSACASTTYQYGDSCHSSNVDSSCPNIAVFFDGTNNTPSDNTNVYKLYDQINSQQYNKSQTMYIEGVGTEWNRKISGNVFGNGMEPRLEKAYQFILQNYTREDKSLYLFGFSRGSYNARILAGLLYTAGLADISNLNKDEATKIVKNIVDAYLKKGTFSEKVNFIKEVDGYKKSQITPQVEFLGVWDSVSALSFKANNESLLGKLSRKYVDQICNIKHVAHALSIDDNRGKRFTPEIMTTPSIVSYCELETTDLQSELAGEYISNKVDEVWFSGAHSDVGGGYSDQENEPISGVSLNWMLRKLAKIDNPIIANVEVAENPLGKSHIGEEALPFAGYFNWNRSIPWLMSDVVHKGLNTLKVHSSVLMRVKNIPRTYREFALVPDDMSSNKNYDDCFDKVPLKGLEQYNDRTKADFTLNYNPKEGVKCFEIIEAERYPF